MKLKFIFSRMYTPIIQIEHSHTVEMNDIYGDMNEQRSAIKTFIKIDSIRRILLNDSIPGGVVARTPAFT